MPHLARRGDSLVELLVALVILEIAGAAALATAFTVERLGRHIDGGRATDAARWEEYRAAESRLPCITAGPPAIDSLLFPATLDRPPLFVTWRCGR